MLRKNTSGQFVHIGGINVSTGAIVTGATWTMRRCLDGTFAAGGATVTEDGSTGFYKVALTQADTNGNDIGYFFTATSCVPVPLNVVTTACDPTSAAFGLSIAKTTNITGFNDIAAPTGFAAATFPTGTVANTTNITAGTITTVTNLTNAPTAGDLTATMKTSVTTAATSATPIAASVTGAVGSVTGNVGGNVTGTVGSVVGAVGSVTGAVGSVTGAVGSVTGAVGSVTGNVGGNVVGSVASVTARVTANSDQVAGSAAAATNLSRGTLGVVLGTVGSASSTTSVVTSSLDPAAAVIDQYKGRIVTFDRATTTTNLRGQSTDITGNTALGVLTVTALTTAPVSGDTFTIT